MKNWLSIAVAVYLICMILHGHHRGFIRLAVSLVALIATVIIVNASMPYVTKYVRENTKIEQALQESVNKAVGLSLNGEKQEGDNEDTETEGEETPAGIPSAQRAMIEGLSIPQQLKDALIENNNSEVYRILGVEAFTDYIGSYLANALFNFIGFSVMFLVVYLLLRLILSWLDLLAKLPILSGINKIAGALMGAVEGLLFLWFGFLIVTIFSSSGWGGALLMQIENSTWLSFLYNNNILNVMVMGIIKGMF